MINQHIPTPLPPCRRNAIKERAQAVQKAPLNEPSTILNVFPAPRITTPGTKHRA